ncbi:MAG: hypothetical protein RLZZ172_52 [Bacteroidota bacterium]|jgi:putative component of membrane protein insertase Oxa1/YidC/SpoIIIJ protein YidD/TM2 domain-containing membrane protein YozV
MIFKRAIDYLLKNRSRKITFSFLLMSSSVIAQNNTEVDSESLDIKNSITAGKDYISVYQKYISGIRGNHCPMYPSCSEYAVSEINKKGMLQGTISGMDRLLRCSHEQSYYAKIYTSNGFKILDTGDKVLDKKLTYKSDTKSFPFNSSYSDTSLLLISQLISNGFYEQAISEVYKLKIKGIRSDEVLAYELKLYNLLTKYKETIYQYEYLMNPKEKASNLIYIQYLYALYKVENYKRIIKERSNVYTKNDSSATLTFERLLISSYLKEKDITGLTEFQLNYLKKSQWNNNLDESKMQIKKLNKKSPLIAGIASALIPGAGYAYAGHKLTGLSSFIFNGLFAFATYSSFKTRNVGMGVLTGLFGCAFYISNIQGSVKSSKRYNEVQYKRIIEKYEITSF